MEILKNTAFAYSEDADKVRDDIVCNDGGEYPQLFDDQREAIRQYIKLAVFVNIRFSYHRL